MLLREPKFSDNGMLLKMAHVHAVTLMETYLQDAFRKSVIESDVILNNLIANAEELKRAKFTIKDFQEKGGSLSSVALSAFADLSFHNVPKFIGLMGASLNAKPKIDISKVSQAVAKRHDIVHRNGKTIDGASIKVSFESVATAIDEIEIFVGAVRIEFENIEF